MTHTLRHLDGEEDFAASFELMSTLRPHVVDSSTYVAQMLRQARQGYRLLAAWGDGQMLGLAGYRQLENLLYGRFIYLDDLVVSPDLQRRGLGARLLQAVREEAVQGHCAHLVLDTGLHMPLAQRFYFRQGLLARGMHFSQDLRPGSQA